MIGPTIVAVALGAVAAGEHVVLGPPCPELGAWRSALGIADPSPELNNAIASLSAVIEAAAPEDDPPSFDAVLAACRETRVGEPPLDELVRSALRATLEQLRSRQPAAPNR